MIALLVAIALGVAFVALDPAGTVQPGALLPYARAALVAGVTLLAELSAGAALLGLRAGAPRWFDALGIGILAHAGALALLAGAGLLTPTTAALTIGAGLFGLLRGGLPLPALPRPGVLGALGIVALLTPALLAALAPPTDTDEIYQHLALARRIAETGGLLGGPLHPDGSRPLPVQVIFAGLYGLGGEAAPRLWHLGVVTALLLAVRDLARERFGPGAARMPALALLGSATFLGEAGLAYNDLVAAFWLLLGAEATLRGRLSFAGWMLGAALAAKYTAAPAVLGIAGVACVRHRLGAARLAWALVPLLPWWLRNAADGLHPLFPYAGWEGAGDFVFVYRQKYGMGQGALDYALLPWNVLMHARTDSFQFLGRASLAWGVLLPGALLTRDRDTRALLFVTAVGFTGWAAGAQILRYLLPLAGVAALAASACRFRAAALVAWTLSLPANLAPLWKDVPDDARVVFGGLPRDDYLAARIPAWPAVAYLREHVPTDEPVALLGAWQGYHVPQPWILGSVEDHVPTRWWLLEHGDDSLRALGRLGVRWLLVGDIDPIRKSYAFLPQDVYDAQFEAPARQLEALLLRDATLEAGTRHWRVYRLDASGGAQ